MSVNMLREKQNDNAPVRGWLLREVLRDTCEQIRNERVKPSLGCQDSSCRRSIGGLLLLVLSLPLAAHSEADDHTPPLGAVERSAGGAVFIASSLCAALGPEVAVPGATYEPGVDVNGRKVAPADLPSSAPPVQLGNFPIEIRKDLAGAFGVPPRGGAYGAKAILGYVTLRGNEAYFNGQPLSGDQRAALIEACRKARRSSGGE